MTQPLKIVLKIGRALVCLGFPVGMSGLLWKFSQALSSVTGQSGQLVVIIIGCFIAIPILMVGTLALLISWFVQATPKLPDQAVSAPHP